MAELEQERASLRTSLELTMVRLSAVEHELKVLRTSTQPGGDLAEMMLTDAIVAALRTFDGGAAPSDIQNALEKAGVIVPLNKVTATLSHLRRAGECTDTHVALRAFTDSTNLTACSLNSGVYSFFAGMP